MSDSMKNGTCYLLLVIFAGSGCAHSRSDRTASVESQSAGSRQTVASDSAPVMSNAAESPATTSTSRTDSRQRQHASKQNLSGWKPTSDTQGNASTISAAANPIQLVSSSTSSTGDSTLPVEPEPSPAATPAAPTLESLEQLALSSNPTLLELQARVAAAGGRWLQVGLKPNPVASISMQEIGNEDSAGQHGALLGQEFVTADKLQLNRNAASWRIRQAEKELQAQQLRVLTDVRRGFYAARVAQERVNVAEELHEIARQSVEKSKKLIRFQEPATVLTQAEIEVELTAVLVDNARIQWQATWRRLAAAIGQPDLPLQEVEGPLTSNAPQLIWDDALDRLHRESPEIAAMAASVEESRWALERACAQATPNVTLQGGVFYDDASSDPFAAIQVSMPLPVNDWNQGGIAEAEANVLAAEQSVERVELNLQSRLAIVFQQYDQARKQTQRYETTILKKARENLDLNRESYNSGQSSYLAVLTAQRSYFQAQLAWLNALDQLWSASVQIEGLLLSDNLNSPTVMSR